jgi:hypothetical protein
LGGLGLSALSYFWVGLLGCASPSHVAADKHDTHKHDPEIPAELVRGLQNRYLQFGALSQGNVMKSFTLNGYSE